MVATYDGNRDAFDKNMMCCAQAPCCACRMPRHWGAVQHRRRAGRSAAPVRGLAWGTASAPSTAAGDDSGRLHLVTPGTAPAAGNSATAAESRALQGKIQQLQSQLDESQRLLSVRNADLAKLQAQLAAAQGMPKAAAPVAAPTPAPAPAAAAAASSPAPEVAAAPASAPDQGSAATAAEASEPAAAESSAVASAPVKHRPHIVTAPVEQSGGSIFDLLRQYWWALAALVVAAAAFFGMRVLRERRQSSFDDSLSHLNANADTITGERESMFNTQPLMPLRDESILVEESGSHIKPRFDGASSRAAHVAADHTISAETAVNLDQGDPLAEARFPHGLRSV